MIHAGIGSNRWRINPLAPWQHENDWNIGRCLYDLFPHSYNVYFPSQIWISIETKPVNKNSVAKYASQVKNNGGVYFVPAFSGLFAPYWRKDARGYSFRSCSCSLHLLPSFITILAPIWKLLKLNTIRLLQSPCRLDTVQHQRAYLPCGAWSSVLPIARCSRGDAQRHILHHQANSCRRRDDEEHHSAPTSSRHLRRLDWYVFDVQTTHASNVLRHQGFTENLPFHRRSSCLLAGNAHDHSHTRTYPQHSRRWWRRHLSAPR